MSHAAWWDGPESTRGLRLATCLTHALPEATLLLHRADGHTLLVAHGRPDAALTPCDLRQVVLDATSVGRFDLLRQVRSWTIGGGVQHLGAGIYGAARPSDGERSFATAISTDNIVALVERCPDHVASDGVEATIKPDLELGVCTVTVVRNDGAGGDVDQVAFWLAGACMVEELILPDGPPSLRC